jgi:hypothetical protein
MQQKEARDFFIGVNLALEISIRYANLCWPELCLSSSLFFLWNKKEKGHFMHEIN